MNMNREIKFRAWAHTDAAYMEMVYFGKTECDNGLWFEAPKHIDDYKNHVMQFTGLKDNKRTTEYPNGQDIYEGDIVETFLNKHGKPIGNGFKSKIQYNSYVGQWQIAYLNINNTFVSDSIGFSYFLEVIGNIYESPLAEG